MKRILLLLISLNVAMLVGCSEPPSQVTKFEGPSPELFYTVEKWNGPGLASDFTRVYAHFKHNTDSDKIVVLDGSYLDISEIRWNSPSDVAICIAKGRTNTFRNDIVLSAGGVSQQIRNHLLEHCLN